MSTTNEATTAAPAARNPVEKERVELRPPVRDTDFKEKYPPDRELGHELDDTARVWRVYRGEAIDHDDALLKTWNETVNILLTFAGLFSAAVTSFVVASTDDLKPDPNAYVANLLFALGNENGGSAPPFAHLPAPPPLEAAPTSLARVVNGLWFTSLFLSLAAALLCILVKQWLDEYTARTRGSAKHPHEWAQRRSFYFQGLTDWNVAAIISFLPLFLHLALFLFLAGLTAFLWDLDNTIRWVMFVLVTLLLAVYAVSLFIPVWSAACPYATPLLAQLRNLGYTALVGVCILRKRAHSWRTMVRRLIDRMFNRRNAASLPTSLYNTASDAPTPDPQIRLLLEQRSRRPFERVLYGMTITEEDLPHRERGDFAARLDCSSLQWLMHDVSDSDAVAVAWQSFGALLEELASPRSSRIVPILPGLVEYAGGERKLWTTLRTDGILDDLQLGRITRSALFLASFMACGLSQVLYWSVPSSDDVYIENTVSPDAALIYAHSVPSERATQVVHRLRETGTHGILLSSARLLFHRIVPLYLNFAPEAVTRSLYYCNISGIDATEWTRVAHILHGGPTCRDANADWHQCNAHCVVNALSARALQLIEDKTSDSSDRDQLSVTPFDIQLIARILSDISDQVTDLSAAVWTILTDTRVLSGRIQRVDRIRATDWAAALYSLAQSSNRFYASVATQYNSIWSMLLRGIVRNHPRVILAEGIDFDGSADNTLPVLAHSLLYFTPWQIEITDPLLRRARLQSALSLVESASMAMCAMDRGTRIWDFSIDRIIRSIPLASFLPTDPALTEDEHTEWVDLFVSAVQHLMVLDPLPWNNLRDAVTASTDKDVKTFFSEVHARLTEVGPCTKGDCVGQGPADWLAALGPVL